MRLTAILLILLAGACAIASAATPLNRNAKNTKLFVAYIKGQYVGLAEYTQYGKVKRTIFWGAFNSKDPATIVPKQQEQFKFNHAGGYNTVFGAGVWQLIKQKNVCKPNPALKAKLFGAKAACRVLNPKTKQFENWALQGFVTHLPNRALRPDKLADDELLYASHWTDDYYPFLWFKWSWVQYGPNRWDHVYGMYGVHGKPYWGGRADSHGRPLDFATQNIYWDVKNPTWRTSKGAFAQAGGWYRFNGFLPHKGTGAFCAALPRCQFKVCRPGPDKGVSYRATALGPGVTPLIRVYGPPPGNYRAGGFTTSFNEQMKMPNPSLPRQPFSSALRDELRNELRTLVGNDPGCSLST